MTTNAQLDALGFALAAINSAGIGGFAYTYNPPTGQLVYSSGVVFNATQPQITSISTAFNALSATTIAASLPTTQLDALGAALASTNRPLIYMAPSHTLATTFGVYNYQLTLAELVAINAAFNTLAVQLVGAPAPPPPAPSALPGAQWGSSRLSLSANVDVYVSSTGSDMTGDGSQGSPWATISKAYNTFVADYDLRGRYTVTCHLLTNISAYNLLQGEIPGLLNPLSFHIRSDNVSTPVTLSAPSGQSCIAAGFRAAFYVSDVIITVPSGGFGLLAEGGMIFGGGITFNGSGGVAAIDSAGNSSAFIQYGGALYFVGCSAISALRAEDSSYIGVGGNIVCSSSSFTSFAGADLLGMIDGTGMTVSGTCGGQQYNASTNGIVFTGGAGTAFPGTGGSTDGHGMRVA